MAKRLRIGFVGLLVLASFIVPVGLKVDVASSASAQTEQCPPPLDLATFEPVLRMLRNSGIHVSKVCQSKLEATFSAPNQCAVVWSDVGGFDVAVFPTGYDAERLRSKFTESVRNGKPYYQVTVTGLETHRTPLVAEGTQRARYHPLRNWVFVAYTDAADQRLARAIATERARHPQSAPN